MDFLTRLEEAIMIAVLRLGDDAYGVSINNEVANISGRSYTLGGLYFALDQLVRKDFLRKRVGGATTKRGGRSKTYYRLTTAGREALLAVRDYQRQLWESVPGNGSRE